MSTYVSGEEELFPSFPEPCPPLISLRIMGCRATVVYGSFYDPLRGTTFCFQAKSLFQNAEKRCLIWGIWKPGIAYSHLHYYTSWEKEKTSLAITIQDLFKARSRAVGPSSWSKLKMDTGWKGSPRSVDKIYLLPTAKIFLFSKPEIFSLFSFKLLVMKHFKQSMTK